MGLYVSVRVKEILDREGIRYGKAFAAQVQEPYPKKLMDTIAPQYFHITGESGAEFDFEVSGCRIKLVCPACGRKKVDPASEPGKYQFVEGSWNGSHIFHTDLSSAMMFCTERILELARKHKWTNFRFVPLEECHEFGHKGIDYVH